MNLSDHHYLGQMARSLLTSKRQDHPARAEMLGMALASLIEDFDQRRTLRRRGMLPSAYGLSQIRLLRRLVCFLRGARAERGCGVWRQNPLGEGLNLRWDETCKHCRLRQGQLDVACGALFPDIGVKQSLDVNALAQNATVSPDKFSAWLSGMKPVPIRAMNKAIGALASRHPIAANVISVNKEMLNAYTRLNTDLSRVIKELMRQWDRMSSESKSAVVTWASSDRPTIKFAPNFRCNPMIPVDPLDFPLALDTSNFQKSGEPLFHRAVRAFQTLPAVYEIRVTPYPLAIDGLDNRKSTDRSKRALRLLVRPIKVGESLGGSPSPSNESD